jgi:hypothetical protein
VPKSESLASIEVPLQYGTGLDTMTFSIYSGTTTNPIATLIETLTITNVPRLVFTMETLPSVLKPTLTPGTSYFLVEKQVNSSTLMNWANNNLGEIGFYETLNGTKWFNETASFDKTPAYSIDFTPVAAPEPSTFVLVAGAFGALLMRRSKRSRI